MTGDWWTKSINYLYEAKDYLVDWLEPGAWLTVGWLTGDCWLVDWWLVDWWLGGWSTGGWLTGRLAVGGLRLLLDQRISSNQPFFKLYILLAFEEMGCLSSQMLVSVRDLSTLLS